MRIELTLRCGENSDKVTCNLPGFLSRKKNFSVVLLKHLDRKFWNDVFWMPNKKPSIKFKNWWLLYLVGEKSHVDPATQVHPIPETRFFWVHMRFLWQKTGWDETENFENHTSSRISKKHLFEFRHPNFPFQGWKSWKTARDCLLIWKPLKISSTITVPIENLKNDIPYAVCESHRVPTTGITPPKKRRVALNVSLFHLFWFLSEARLSDGILPWKMVNTLWV